MKLSVIIPVLNEEKTIKQVLDEVLSQNVFEVIVVNDGSTDKTGEVLKDVSDKVTVINQEKTEGKGAAIISALSKVTGDFIIIQDADLEYNPAEYQKMITQADNNKVIYGSRIMGNNPHAYQRTYLGNVLITFFCNLLFGTKLTDSYTCYKLIPTKIAKSLKLSSKGFEIEAEITGKLSLAKVPIIEVPITYSPRSYEQGKKIKLRDALIGAWTFFKIRFGYSNGPN